MIIYILTQLLAQRTKTQFENNFRLAPLRKHRFFLFQSPSLSDSTLCPLSRSKPRKGQKVCVRCATYRTCLKYGFIRGYRYGIPGSVIVHVKVPVHALGALTLKQYKHRISCSLWRPPQAQPRPVQRGALCRSALAQPTACRAAQAKASGRTSRRPPLKSESFRS